MARAQFALQGIEDETERLQRNAAEEDAVVFFAEDNRRCALLFIQAK